MSTQTLVLDEKATALAHALSALTGESVSTAVLVALRERLSRARVARQLPASSDSAEALGRALRASAGAGIPVNHCWGGSDHPRRQKWASN